MDPYQGAGCDLAISIRRPVRHFDNGDRDQFIHAFGSVKDAQAVKGCYLVLDPGLALGQARVAMVNSFFNDPRCDDDLTRHQEEFIVGIGFPSLIRPPPPRVSDTTAQLGSMAVSTDDAPQIPFVPKLVLPDVADKLWNECDKEYRDVILSQLGDYAPMVSKYFETVCLPILAIIGFAGSGKTQKAVYMALLLLQSHLCGRLYCAAPTHVATSNFASRLNELSDKVDRLLPATYKRRTLPMIVRGFNVKDEVNAFMQTVRGETPAADKYRNPTWSMKLSVCEWMCKVADVGGHRLRERDNKALHDLRDELKVKPRWTALRKFVAKEISAAEMKGLAPRDDPTIHKPGDLIQAFAVRVLHCATVVCTTPFQATGPEYLAWNRSKTKATMLDEAGAITVVVGKRNA